MSNDGQSNQDDENQQIQEGLGDESGRGGSDEAANNPGKEQSQAGQNEQGRVGSNPAAKNPDDWTTGNEPATPAQKSYMSTMAVEVDEAVPDDLNKADASKKIEELQERTGRDSSSERP